MPRTEPPSDRTTPVHPAGDSETTSEATAPLHGLGLDLEEERVYLELLHRGEATLTALAAALGVALPTLEEAVGALQDIGLVTRPAESFVVAVPPDIGLGALLAKRQLELQRAQARAGELLEVHRRRSDRTAAHVDLLTSSDQINTWLIGIEASVRSEVLCFVGLPMLMLSDPDQPVRTDYAVRYIYERQMLEQPGVPDEIDALLDAGREVRIAPSIPAKMIIYDRAVALVPVVRDQQDMSPGALLIRSTAVVDSFVELFELRWRLATPAAWDSGEPTGGSALALESADLTVLALLLSGLPDKAVAARMGTSERTVQRRVHRLMSLTGTSSRMQLAWHAAKTGLVPG